MPFLPEIIISLVFLTGLALYAYHNSPARKKEKIKLLKNYRRAQNLSMKLQDIISLHILTHDAFNDEFRPGLSYGDYLKELQEEHLQKLPEGLYLRLKRSFSRRLARKANKLIDSEMDRLCHVKKQLTPIATIKQPA